MKQTALFSLQIQKVKYLVLALAFLLTFSFQNIYAQIDIDITETRSKSDPKLNRKRGLEMLKQIKDVLEERYYDPNYNGINLDERFKAAEERIKTQEYNWQIFRTIAQVLVDFNDSHTRFYPPNRSTRVEYGFSMQMIGHRCFIVDVKKGSDAEAKGLKTGDEIVGVGNFAPTRENLWKMQYIFYALDPQESIKLAIANPDKTEREVIVNAKFVTLEERRKQREKRKAEEKEKPYKCQTVSPQLIACKLKTFSVEKSVVDKMMKEVGQHSKMILDLRGNGGGYVKTMVHLAGYFFDREVKIGELKLRKSSKEIKAKSHGDKVSG
jgi:C-terminal processing protease CtpA/Prc